MASLQLNGYTSTQSGSITSTGFARVDRYNGDEVIFNFTVNIWWSEETYTANQCPIDTRHYSIPTVDVAGTTALYSYLATLPEFAGSTVVL